ncbi:hypothetical protein ACWC10_20350 [Streptomyces sp. NPDC001595]
MLATAVVATALAFGAAGPLDVGWRTPAQVESAAQVTGDVGWSVEAASLDVGWRTVAGGEDVGWSEPVGADA